jgi:hypothetical protein
MTNEEVIRGNKLIAEFMGASIDDGYGDKETYRFPLRGAPKEYASYVWSSDGLQYHSSWDWLLPVWQKCIKEIGLWMVTGEHDKLWYEKSESINRTITCEFDCAKAATKISQLIEWCIANKPAA